MRKMVGKDIGVSDMPQPVCDCCRRAVERVRGSMWHGTSKICPECFGQWYDPDNGSFDNCNPLELGNYVRSKHGLSALPN